MKTYHGAGTVHHEDVVGSCSAARQGGIDDVQTNARLKAGATQAKS
jgi:hypothetical protein